MVIMGHSPLFNQVAEELLIQWLNQSGLSIRLVTGHTSQMDSAHAGIGYVCNILRLTTNSKAISAQPTPGCTLSYQSFAVRSFTPAIVACSSETKVGCMGVTYHISSPPPCNLASVVWTTRLVLVFSYKPLFLIMLMQPWLRRMPGNKREEGLGHGMRLGWD